MITQVDGSLIENHTITAEDVNTSEAGGALVTKVINADGTITITSTGADVGTGEVSIKANLITDHKDLTSIGTNDHSQIDANISATQAHMANNAIHTPDKYYRHVQNIPNTVWAIQHNMNKFPSVTIFDSSNAHIQVYGDVEYIDVNTVQLSFSVPFGGEAYLN
jgi:hypothetical protein